MPSINSALHAQRIIQMESHESPSFLRKVHRLDPPIDNVFNNFACDGSEGDRSVVSGIMPTVNYLLMLCNNFILFVFI